MSTDLRLPNGLEVLDGLAAYENFSRYSKLYIKQLAAGEGPPDADGRRLLLTLAQRSLDLVQPADLHLQSCLEQIHQVVGVPEFDQRLKDLAESESLGQALKNHLSGKDLIQTATGGIQDARARLVAERERLPRELQQLQAGERPVREEVPDDISADAEAGIGAAFMIAGLSMATAAALAPKTAGASLVLGVAVAGAAVEVAGAIAVLDAIGVI